MFYAESISRSAAVRRPGWKGLDDYAESNVFENSAAIRGDRWKRSLIYRYNGRRSDLASVKEKNDDLVLGENNKAKKRSASADPIKRINGERSADPTIRGPRSDPNQEDAQLDTPAPGTSVSARDAALGPFYPGSWLGEKSLRYLRYIDGGCTQQARPGVKQKRAFAR